VLTDRDYSKIIKAETRRHQQELAGQYGAMINNRQYVDQVSVLNMTYIFFLETIRYKWGAAEDNTGAEVVRVGETHE